MACLSPTFLGRLQNTKATNEPWNFPSPDGQSRNLKKQLISSIGKNPEEMRISGLGGGFPNVFYVHPETWGRWTHFDEHIFQRGWFNHQPVALFNLKKEKVWTFFESNLIQFLDHSPSTWDLLTNMGKFASTGWKIEFDTPYQEVCTYKSREETPPAKTSGGMRSRELEASPKKIWQNTDRLIGIENYFILRKIQVDQPNFADW